MQGVTHTKSVVRGNPGPIPSLPAPSLPLSSVAGHRILWITESIVSDAAGYTKTALVKNPITWLIFIICGLPFALIRFVFDPKTIFTGTTIHWDLIPWPRLVALCCAGLLLSFIVSGYLVRVYRGTTPPPRFDSWCSLYLDGIKLAIVGFLWFVPALIIFVAALAFMFFGVHGSASMGTMIGRRVHPHPYRAYCARDHLSLCSSWQRALCPHRQHVGRV